MKSITLKKYVGSMILFFLIIFRMWILGYDKNIQSNMLFRIMFDVGIIKQGFVLSRTFDFVLFRLILSVTLGRYYLSFVFPIRDMMLTRIGSNKMFLEFIRNIFIHSTISFLIFLGLSKVFGMVNTIDLLELIIYFLMWQNYVLIINVASLRIDFKIAVLISILIEFFLNCLVCFCIFDNNYLKMQLAVLKKIEVKVCFILLMLFVGLIVTLICKKIFKERKFLINENN